MHTVLLNFRLRSSCLKQYDPLKGQASRKAKSLQNIHIKKIHFGKIHFGNQSLKAVGHTFQKMYDAVSANVMI